MEAPRTVSQSYVAFASAVRRLLLPSTGHAPKRRLRPSRLTHHRSFSSTVETDAPAVRSASSSDTWSSRPLPIYATYGLQSLIAQRMPWDHWPAGPSHAFGSDELHLPLPFTPPLPPRSVLAESQREHVEAQESRTLPLRNRLSKADLRSASQAARLFLSRGKLGRGMLTFQDALSKMTVPHTLLPHSTPGERKSITPDEIVRENDFEAILLELKLIFSGRRQLDRAADWERDAWRPAGLPFGRNIGDVPQKVLAAFAMGTTFDSCIAVGYRPSSRMVAILLSCLSHLLPTEAFTDAVELAMTSRGGDIMDRDILAAILVGYGRAGQPELGEAYLARHKDLRNVSTAQSKLNALDADLNGWSHDVGVWCALVRSYAIAGQHEKATTWLRRYSRFCQRSDVPEELKPEASPSVYLTLLTSIVERQPTRSTHEALNDNVVREVMDVLTLMMQHGVKAHTPMLNFLADFERRRGKHVSAKKLLTQVASIDAQAGEMGHIGDTLGQDGQAAGRSLPNVFESRDKWDSHTYRQAFELIAQSTIAGVNTSPNPDSSLPSPRCLLSSLLKAHYQKTRGRPRVTSSALHSITLLSAIKSCLAHRDYPAAVVALQTFTVCSLPLLVAEVFKIISHGVKKHSALAPSEMYSRLNDGIGNVPKIGPLQGILEAAILHELREGQDSNCSDSPEWIRAALAAIAPDQGSLAVTDKIHMVMQDVRKEVLPTRRPDKLAHSPEQSKAARKQAEMRARRRSQQLGTVEVD